MKLLLAAAAAAFAMPAMAQQATPAQTTPPPAPMPAQTMPAMGAPTMAPMAPVVQPLPDAPMAADGKVPMCSRTVTDHCMERSNGRGERLHSTPPAN